MTRACGLSVQKERGVLRTGRSKRASRYKRKTTAAVVEFRWSEVFDRSDRCDLPNNRLSTYPTYLTHPTDPTHRPNAPKARP